MPKIYVSYAIAVVVVWFMNGYALLQHLSLVTEINGFIAATLLANILTAPFVMWAAYIFGQIAHERLLRRKHAKAVIAR